jgi:hypothetical protein
MTDINKPEKIDVIPYWKEILKEFLNNPAGIRMISHEKIGGSALEIINTSNDNLLKFSVSVGYLSQIESTIEWYQKKTNSIIDDAQVLITIRIFLTTAFEVIKKWGYIQDENIRDSITHVEYTHWCLTEKGIDVALKLQENADNERRFLYQSEVSKTLKRNSNWSIGISVTALFLTFSAVTLAFIKLERTDILLEHSERRLTLAEENQKTNLSHNLHSISNLKAAQKEQSKTVESPVAIVATK